MNRTTKASVATAAGIVLLLGGGASLAYWTDSSNSGSGTQTIAAGTLNITPVDSGAWTKGFYNAAGTQVVAPAAATLSTVKLVPGNRLVYTQTFNVVATGQDLYFTVAPTNNGLGATTNGLAGRLDASSQTFAFASSGATIVPTGVTANTYRLATGGSTGTATITLTWTINWPFGDSTSVTADNLAKLGTVTLTQGAVTLTQVAAL